MPATALLNEVCHLAPHSTPQHHPTRPVQTDHTAGVLAQVNSKNLDIPSPLNRCNILPDGTESGGPSHNHKPVRYAKASFGRRERVANRRTSTPPCLPDCYIVDDSLSMRVRRRMQETSTPPRLPRPDAPPNAEDAARGSRRCRPAPSAHFDSMPRYVANDISLGPLSTT